MPNKIPQYNPKLNKLARKLRKNMTLGEVLLWQEIRNRTLGYQFHRQIPIKEYIVDFYLRLTAVHMITRKYPLAIFNGRMKLKRKEYNSFDLMRRKLGKILTELLKLLNVGSILTGLPSMGDE